MLNDTRCACWSFRLILLYTKGGWPSFVLCRLSLLLSYEYWQISFRRFSLLPLFGAHWVFIHVLCRLSRRLSWAGWSCLCSVQVEPPSVFCRLSLLFVIVSMWVYFCLPAQVDPPVLLHIVDPPVLLRRLILLSSYAGWPSYPPAQVDLTFALFRLTLLLSCAMKFNKYPHDEQLCKLSMESSKWKFKELVH